MKIAEANWAKIHIASLLSIILVLSSSCSATTSNAPLNSKSNYSVTSIDPSGDFSKKESSELEENHDKDKDMDLTEIESIQELNEQNPLSHQLEGTGIREVVIEIGDFSFDALFGGPSSGEPIMLLHG
ncbi:MAG: hypothetical protein ACPHI5_08190, partial [Acidimicrobiales bacterium]